MTDTLHTIICSKDGSPNLFCFHSNPFKPSCPIGSISKSLSNIVTMRFLDANLAI